MAIRRRGIDQTTETPRARPAITPSEENLVTPEKKNERTVLGHFVARPGQMRAGDISVLQRRYGNRAVSGLMPAQQRIRPTGGPVIQRMTLDQAGLAGNLDEAGERTLVSDGREANMYVQEVGSKASSKVAALQKAAQLNGALGKKADIYALTTLGINRSNLRYRGLTDAQISNAKWTSKSEALGDSGVKKIDPFFFAPIVPFTENSQDEKLELLFQHATSWTGYVEAIYDSTNKNTGNVPTMYVEGTETKNKAKDWGEVDTKGHYRNRKFSNVHDTTDSRKLTKLLGGKEEKSLDAYTKIAGEGARWQCVRKHAAKLQNNSFFFTADSSIKNKVWGITFRTLWGQWASAFGKRYDIPDSEVKREIHLGNLYNVAAPRKKSSLSAKDYDLDLGKSHGT